MNSLHKLVASFGLTCLVTWLADAEPCPREPFEPFSDRMLLGPIDESSSRNVKHLGRLIKLDTLFDRETIFPCKFRLQTRTKESEHEMRPNRFCFTNLCGDYKFDLMNLTASGFDPELRTIILIPGFLSDDRVEWLERVARLWLEAERCNVIKVSWVTGNRYLYPRAASGTPIVARQLTILLHHLAGLHGRRFTERQFASRIQIVGHSLGAHIAAFVGQDLGGRLGRITGLDPAGPIFDEKPRALRLDPTDALLVDAIHTNRGQLRYSKALAGSALVGLDWLVERVPSLERNLGEAYGHDADTAWFGIDRQVGHVDYYANDGRVQPGCQSYVHKCDHDRSKDIYEDLLAHELRVLQAEAGRPLGEEGRRRRRHESRLLAFKARDYDSFRAGESLQDSACEPMLGMGARRQHVEAAARRCSLPIDLLAPVDELVDELLSVYGIESLKDPMRRPEAGSRYFFSTRSTRPLVGNHYMLKIGHSDRDVWSADCSTRTEVTMPDGSTSEFDLLEDQSSVATGYSSAGGHQSAGAIFVAPTGEPLSSLLWDSQWSPERALPFLPVRVKLTVRGWQQSNSVFRAVVDKALEYLSVKSGRSKCTLNVRSIEISPLTSSKLALVGLYGNPHRVEPLSEISDSLTRNLTHVDMTNDRP